MRQCYEDLSNKVEDSIACGACDFANEVQERFNQEKQYSEMVAPILEFIETQEEQEWRGILDQVVEYE